MAEFLVARLRARLRKGEPIASITAYDYFSARLAAEAGMDFVLVGDSLGNVIHGAPTTVAVTLDEVIYHARIVTQHFPAERVVLDIPLGPYLADTVETARECIRGFKQSGCGAVKLEGATHSMLQAIELLGNAGVPVMAHIGLQPQRVHAQGGFKRQGVTEEESQRLLDEALALEQAGACAVVLEMVQPQLAEWISATLAIPTIGIGSGAGCDGQILVFHDVLGLLPGAAPGFARQYAQLYGPALDALAQYAADVRSRSFPEAPDSSAAPAQRDREAARDTAARKAAPQDEHTSALLSDLGGTDSASRGQLS